MIRHAIPPEVPEMALSRYLRRAWPLLPGHALKEILKRRDVRVNGARSGGDVPVRGGDLLEIYGDARHFEPEVELLFDDGRLLAALDAETEAAALTAFKNRELDKRYRALLGGEPFAGEKILKAQLFKDAKRGSVRVSERPSPGSREIVTRVKPLRTLPGGLWEAELEPVTGRTHQLRAHMAHLGCPILGDDKYGDRALNKRLGFANRLCLWCERIAIPAGGALADWAGREFFAEAPEWVKG